MIHSFAWIQLSTKKIKHSLQNFQKKRVPRDGNGNVANAILFMGI